MKNYITVNKGIFLVVVLVVGGIAGTLYIKKSAPSIPVTDTAVQSSQISGPRLTVTPHEFDFGKIRQGGGVVSTVFELYNSGSEEVIITDVIASCSCASAEVDKKTLAPGERGTLTVRFDPNYHYESEEKFFRTVIVKSNIQGEAPEVKIWVQVDYDLGKDALKFPGR